jgi:hypothetical protein
MTVRIENIDELRRRANVSYEVAKDALEKCNDDLLEALVYLEKQNMVKPNTACENSESLWDKFKKLVRKGNNTKLIIHKKGANVLSISVTFAVIITVIAPYVTLLALVAALFTGHRIKLEGKDMKCDKVNEMMDKVADGVDCAKRKMAEDVSNEEEIK